MDASHRFELEITVPGSGKRRFPLREGESVIGRSPGCEISISENSISRRHARFEISKARILVEDLDSLNGTTVDSRRLKGATSVEVGDELVFGDLEARIVYTEAPDTEVPEEIWLEILNTSLKGKSHQATTTQIVIGRSHAADFQINHQTISRVHATLHYSPEDDGWMLTDQRSANGTFINGVMVSKALVDEQEKIRLGDVNVALRTDPPSPQRKKHTLLLIVLIGLLGVAIALLVANLLGLLTH